MQRIKTSNIEELNIPAGVARFDIIKKFTENDTNRLKTEKIHYILGTKLTFNELELIRGNHLSNALKEKLRQTKKIIFIDYLGNINICKASKNNIIVDPNNLPKIKKERLNGFKGFNWVLEELKSAKEKDLQK